MKNSTCGFQRPWIGICDNKTPCEKHSKLTCFSCGQQATTRCDAQCMGLMCGVPHCDEHQHCRGISIASRL